MPCHGCATTFGLWTKENCCPSCGFSFCNSCLKQKCVVPKLSNKVVKVCRQCFSSISISKEVAGSEMLPSAAAPDIFLKRLEALASPPKPPVIMYRAQPRMQQLVKGLSSKDLDIARRLEKLREDRLAAKSVPTEDELARRLALLKGQDDSQSSSKTQYTPAVPDTRSGEQQAQDLFTQCKEEVEIDSKMPQLDDVIVERLNRLRNLGGSSSQKPLIDDAAAKPKDSEVTLDEIAQLLANYKMEASECGKQLDLATVASLEKLRARLVQQAENMGEGSSDNDNNDDEKAAAKILKKVQAEVDLERSLGIISVDDEVMDTENDMEELPWCIICNEDAKVRCLGCDSDLYCKSCFQQGHVDEDMKSHAFELYKKK